MVSHRIFSEKIYIFNESTKRIFKDNIIPKNIQNSILEEIKQIENDTHPSNNTSINILDLGIKSELIFDISKALNKYHESKEISKKLNNTKDN